MRSRRHAKIHEEAEEDEKEMPIKRSRTLPPPSKRVLNDSTSPVVPPPSSAGAASHLPYSDSHRIILQYFMLTKVVEEHELVSEAIPSLLSTTMRLPEVLTLIKEINEKMFSEDLSMELRPRDMVEFERQPKVWGLISTKVDDVSKLCTRLEPWEITLFQACLHLIASSTSGGIFSVQEAMDAFQAAAGNTVISTNKNSHEIQTCLNKLVDLVWLSRAPNRAGFFSVGSRSMLELSEYLKSLGAEECEVSSQVVIKTKAYKRWLAQGKESPT